MAVAVAGCCCRLRAVEAVAVRCCCCGSAAVLLRRRRRPGPALGSMALLLLLAAPAAAVEATPRKNVLHMVADDLRTELSLAYRHPEVVTPHLDALTKKSLVFQNCYCQQPICSPSRNSFMSGLTPDHTRAWNFIQYHHRAISMLIRTIWID